MKRWYCPACGDGKLAPARMADDDVRRYCLSCSAKAQRLVRRWQAGSADAAKKLRLEDEARATEQRARLDRIEEVRLARRVVYHKRGRCTYQTSKLIVHCCKLPMNHKGGHDIYPLKDIQDFDRKVGLK